MSKMYTKAGDKGSTTFLGGQVVSKSNLRVSCYGTLDELNAVIGVIRSQKVDPKELDDALELMQRNLFTIGAILANPNNSSVGRQILFDAPAQTAELEKLIDEFDAKLPQLTNFVLPGGTRVASLLHLARTVTRRAERILVALSEQEEIDGTLIAYLNRVSSALFVFARTVNHRSGVREQVW